MLLKVLNKCALIPQSVTSNDWLFLQPYRVKVGKGSQAVFTSRRKEGEAREGRRWDERTRGAIRSEDRLMDSWVLGEDVGETASALTARGEERPASASAWYHRLNQCATSFLAPLAAHSLWEFSDPVSSCTRRQQQLFLHINRRQCFVLCASSSHLNASSP